MPRHMVVVELVDDAKFTAVMLTFLEAIICDVAWLCGVSSTLVVNSCLLITGQLYFVPGMLI